MNVRSLAGEKLRRRLDKVVAASTRDENGREYRNAVVLFDAPRRSFTYRGASGIGDLVRGEPMTADRQFYIESITKTFTATVVLQLAEEGKLGEKGLDASLGELEVFPAEVLDQLHRFDGASYGFDITVSQLLHHQTGMKNFTYDDEGGGVADYPGQPFAPGSFLGVLLNHPQRGLAGLLEDARKRLPEGTDPARWIAETGLPEGLDPDAYYLFSRPFAHWDLESWRADPQNRMAGLLNFYLSGMNQAAMFPPGEDFAYTDTNFLVLGLLVEEVTGNSLHSELRRRIFDPLSMQNTYMSYATDPAADGFRRALSELWALDGLPIVKIGLNRSMMWSDAGIVSTVDELNLFVRALVTGELFDEESTLDTMTALPAGEERGYGCGIGVDRRGDDTILFHSGGAASWMIYYVGADISFVGTMNDATAAGHQRFDRLQHGILRAVAEHGFQIESPF